MSHKILITNQSKPFTKLQNWCNKFSIEFIRISFIKTAAVKGIEIPKTDWIFFSSPKCVETYLENYSIYADKVAVYGKGTAETVQEKGLKIDFIGPNTSNAVEIAEALEAKADGTVFFPISQISRKSIISAIKGLTCISLVTYKTEIESNKISVRPTIIIFTSPSNIRGYLLQNELDKDVQLIVFGRTTANEIKTLKLSNPCHILPSPREEEIIKTLEKLIH